MTSVVHPSSPTGPDLRPPRLNAAGMCLWCLGFGCIDPWCIQRYENTTWEICPRCGGTQFVDGHLFGELATERCNCISGVNEIATVEWQRSISGWGAL